MLYSEKLIRGILNDGFYNIKDGQPKASAFHFDYNKTLRPDGNREISISWYDNEEAMTIIMEMRKEDGKHRFPDGAIILITEQLDLAIRLSHYQLSYERNEKNDNKYHGNLLLKDIPYEKMKNVAAAIALAFDEFRWRNN